MDPLTPDLLAAATEALKAIEEHLARNCDLSDELKNKIAEDRTALMLSALTDSRHDLDQTSFADWGRKLECIVRPGTSAYHRLQHERSLWKLNAQDFKGLVEFLSTWQTEDTDPMWSLRKAALLMESGDLKGSRDLVLQTLQRAERDWSRDRRVLTAGRLGWALHWRQALNWARWWDESREGNSRSEPDADLWAQLAPYGGDARSDLDAYVRQMTKEQREDSPWTFDLRRPIRITMSHKATRLIRSATRVIRLLELSGLPSRIPRVRITGNHIEMAARVIVPFIPAYAARLLLFAGAGDEKALNAVVSQTSLARMSDQEASSLFNTARRARDHFVGCWTPGEKAADFYRERAENAMEIMSCCVARYGAAPASETFGWAIRYSRPPSRWVDNSFWSCVARLWERSWKAMDLESKQRTLYEILRKPIPEDAFTTDKDPGNLLLSEHLRINRTDVDEPIWASCVHQICTALRGNEDARRLAFERLNAIVQKNVLSEAEKREVGLSLWGTVHRESDGLPHIRLVLDWTYLILPEPEHGIAERRFRAKWIGRDMDDATSKTGDETIQNVATAWNPRHLGKRAILLADDEQAWFWKFVEQWLRLEASQRLFRRTTSIWVVKSLVDIMTHRRVPTSVLNYLAENAPLDASRRSTLVEEWGNPESEYLMMVAAAALGSKDFGEAEHRLRLGARSAKARESLAAWRALEWWIRRSGQDTVVPLVPPAIENVRDIGVAIGTSQHSGRLGALRAASAVYRSQNPEFIEAIHSRIIQGLRQLQSELDYRTSVEDRQTAEELPLQRHWCVSLAWAMTDAGKGDDEVVKSWIEAGHGDPLVIVRFVAQWNAASKVSGDT